MFNDRETQAMLLQKATEAMQGHEIPGNWVSVFQPNLSSNECCVSCKHTSSGCNWSEHGQPVPGWVAIETPCGSKTGTKIVFCPQYTPDDDNRHYDYEGCIELLCKWARQTKEELIKLYESIAANRVFIGTDREKDYFNIIRSTKLIENILDSRAGAIKFCRAEANFEPTALEKTMLLEAQDGREG